MKRTVRVLDGFDDPAASTERWSEVFERTPSATVFSTREWLRSWWECLGRGELLLTVCEEDGRTVALAPWFTDGATLFFLGVGSSDYLDVLGSCDAALLAELVSVAAEHVPGFVGAVLHHLRADSTTLTDAPKAAARLGLRCTEAYRLPAPALRLDPGVADAAAARTSLRRHERWFAEHGNLSIVHLRDAQEVRAALPGFFEQHVQRWSATDFPSLFLDPRERAFYERLVDEGARAGWLRFTSVTWNDDAIAYHMGMCFRGRYLWYKPSFAIALASRSPGEVLLRHLLLAAACEGAHTFDFGIGDEAFKHRFANEVPEVVSVWLSDAVTVEQ